MSQNQAADTTEQPEKEYREFVSTSVTHQLKQMVLTDRSALIGFVIISVLVLVAIFATIDNFFFNRAIISSIWYDPQTVSATEKFAAPGGAHPLGTDQLGRDVLARLIYGARVSLTVAILGVGISATLGIIFGAIAGFVGGWVDNVIMRIVDSLMAFPGIILAIAVAGLLGPSIYNIIIALSIQGWVTYARLIRGEVLSVRESEYVTAARGIGVSRGKIIVRDVLPNSISAVIVQATLNLGTFVIAEAGLSFLGLGPQNAPSWGKMLSLGQTYVDTAWWLSVVPGICIFITVMGFNLLGDSLQDMLDPRDSTGERRSI